MLKDEYSLRTLPSPGRHECMLFNPDAKPSWLHWRTATHRHRDFQHAAQPSPLTATDRNFLLGRPCRNADWACFMMTGQEGPSLDETLQISSPYQGYVVLARITWRRGYPHEFPFMEPTNVFLAQISLPANFLAVAKLPFKQ